MFALLLFVALCLTWIAHGDVAGPDEPLYCGLIEEVVNVLQVYPEASAFCASYLRIRTRSRTITAIAASTVLATTVITRPVTINGAPIYETVPVTAPAGTTTLSSTVNTTTTRIISVVSTVSLGTDCATISGSNAKRAVAVPVAVQ